MKATFLALIFAFSIPAYSKEISIRITGVNREVIFEQKLENTFPHVGALTDSVLTQALKQKFITEYKGSTGGINSINHLGNQIEIISDTEMNAFGWCYQVDGEAPDLMPDEFLFTGEEHKIDWFYAYAHLDHNTWTSMCTPADHMPKEQ